VTVVKAMVVRATVIKVAVVVAADVNSSRNRILGFLD
jgi:hypothetical protein